MALALLLGCAGTGPEGLAPGGPESGFKFNTVFLGCGDSLDITMSNGGTFPPGSTLKFQGPGTFDGSPVLIQGGKTLDCGFPSPSPKGFYQVILNGKVIGQVQNLCST